MDEKNEKEVWERLTSLESSLKSLHKRIDRWENIAESIQKNAENTQKVVVEIQYMREDINTITNKVDALESTPKKNWQTLITGVISALTSGIVGFLVAQLIGG